MGGVMMLDHFGIADGWSGAFSIFSLPFSLFPYFPSYFPTPYSISLFSYGVSPDIPISPDPFFPYPFPWLGLPLNSP